MNALYVTSFAPDMYAATGVHLVDSFLASGSEGAMLLCHEGGLDSQISQASPRLSCFDLDSSPFLREWLQRNRDIIPAALGGDAQPCDCPNAGNPFGEHVFRCAYQWFNKNASRWFRKIVSLEQAMLHGDVDTLIWIDCDCRFKKALPFQVWSDLFDGASALYHKSPERNVIESGVIAFRMNESGRGLLQDVIERYRSGRFREDRRWDDAFQFQRVFESTPGAPVKDLATSAGFDGYVLPSSPLGEYLDHYKGVHGSVLRLMR